MATDPSAKRPLFAGQFAWAISKKSGIYVVIFGPDPMDATDDELFVISSKDDPTKVEPVEHATSSIQDFVTIRPGEYAVIHNPAENFTVDHPNGPYTKGRNEVKALMHGCKRVVTKGYFPIWPGQRVEVRKMHTLSSNQYLMAVVESEEIDTSAPYYDLTLKCASIKKAIINETKPILENENAEAVNTEAANAEVVNTEKNVNTESKIELGAGQIVETESSLVLGQRIIIPGNLTPTYIPPTGIEIVLEHKERRMKRDIEESSKSSITSQHWSKALKEMWDRSWLNPSNLLTIFSKARMPQHAYRHIQSEFNSYGETFDTFIDALRSSADSDDIQNLIKYIANANTNDSSESTESTEAIQQAVVLGPTEFCVLLDEDGKPQVKKGPGRVFPGPYDVFRTEGSRNRVYDAYHLRPDRGILLRIVVDSIKRDELLNQLPKGSKLEVKELFLKGDEVFISGFNSYLIPSPAIEVIDPSTRKPHIGNDHETIYVQAIGVDQKSGVYVADVETGNIKLVRGEKKLILDPRSEKHIHRKVPSNLWNLIIARNEQHKAADSRLVDTPWALSVIIPNNEAVLVTSKDGRRAEVGPKTILLEYEEWLEVLSLSRGRPKTDVHSLETCFLRVSGNRSSDQIILETADYVQINIDVQYSVEFEGDTPEEQIKWFNYKNYVKFFTHHLRSRLRAAARHSTLSELYPNMADFVRDTILGAKDENGQRLGMLFKENNMRVSEVDILTAEIPDPTVAMKFTETNQRAVVFELQKIINNITMQTEIVQDELDEKKNKIRQEKLKRDHEVDVSMKENEASLSEMDVELNDKLAAKRRDQIKLNEALELLTIENKSKQQIEEQGKLVDLEKLLIEAKSAAEVDKFKAIQPELIAALEGLGNKQVLQQLAQSIPAATGELGYLLDAGGFAGLFKMVEGSPLADTLKSLKKVNLKIGENNSSEL